MNTAKRTYSNWSKNEDNILKEKVFENLREGNTLTNAFRDVSEIINRTVGSVTFRWNSKLRKEYIEDINLIKKTFNKKGDPKSNTEKEPKLDLDSKNDLDVDINNLDYEKVIEYIFNLKKAADSYKKLESNYNDLLEKYENIHQKFNDISKIVS